MISRALVSRRAGRLVSMVLGTLLLAGAARPSEFVTPGEVVRKSDWVKTHLETDRPALPFAFVYGGKPSGELLQAWPKQTESTRIDAARTRRVMTWTDPATGLEVRCVAVDYADFPAVEWTVYFKNTGKQDTPILEQVQGLDLTLERGQETKREFVLHYWKGDTSAADLYQPLEQTLAAAAELKFAPVGGRGSNGAWPYYNLVTPDGGLMIAVGWPGQWKSSFVRDAGRSLNIRAGQELTHLTLRPGEQVRTPLAALLFWQGENFARSQNLWRRWMFAHNVPRSADGALPPPLLFGNTSGEFNEMCNANEENQKYFIDRYIQEHVPITYWWMDAGWYPCDGNWPKTGTWEPDLKRFPRGLRAISDHARTLGVKTLVWFEPERVAQGTWISDNHPDWLLGKALLNLGRDEVRNWLTDHFDRVLREQGISLYRQDFNIDPLGFWRKNDPPDRQGISENLHIQNYLAYWDELRKRHPNLIIDSCASGGRRNDLETMRRAIALHPTDYNYGHLAAKQAFHASLFQWLPCFGSNTVPVDTVNTYAIRSGHAMNVVLGYDLRSKNLDYDLLRKLTAEWQKVVPYYRGDFYPLTADSRDEEHWLAWQFDRSEQGDGIVEAFRREKTHEPSATFHLSGIDASARYEVTDLDSGQSTSYNGSELTEHGLPVVIPAQPGALTLRYKRLSLAASVLPASGTGTVTGKGRQVLDLNGTWQVEQGSLQAVPSAFTHTVVVPGLIDMARPAFTEVGKPSSQRRAFWYRRSFKFEGDVPEVALLKIHKACYGTRVILNGYDLGEHQACFTPGYFDLKSHVKGDGTENELIIGVGADRDCLPPDLPRGWDFEKYLFIPGLYDSVELILTGAPFIKNVQIVPDIVAGTARALVELEAGPQAAEVKLSGQVQGVRGADAAGVVAQAATSIRLAPGKTGTAELLLTIPNARLWSPEDPFLYELKLSTGTDSSSARFGMRSFRFDAKSGRAVLNGKPYFLRGTNICAYRFFEDESRGDRPWRAEWVRRLHQQFKTMHWNSIRYCIGFPPDFWYDIADEEGLLIQDEFPIWLLNPQPGKDGSPEFPRTEKIIPQYVEWMRERWNHPCVVIWDGQNESLTDQTGPAIQAVRQLDLSHRPWENGWAEPQDAGDCVESHPYLFIRNWEGQKPFKLSMMPEVAGVPHLNDRQQALRVPIIINEYDWLWLNRDGMPTCLTDKVYQSLLGTGNTLENRRRIHARYVAALTEFWRCHREAAGVLHFCGLGYSRPGDQPRPVGGATSDDWIDLEQLTFEPNFQKYVRDAFSPVGLMLDFWAETVAAGSEQNVKIYVINDLEPEWKGELRLRLLKGSECVSTRTANCHVSGFGREIVTLAQTMPTSPGDYTLIAELADSQGNLVRSLRDFQIAASGQAR